MIRNLGIFTFINRRKLNYDAASFAKILGVSPTTYSRIENCEISVNENLVNAILNFFGTSELQLKKELVKRNQLFQNIITELYYVNPVDDDFHELKILYEEEESIIYADQTYLLFSFIYYYLYFDSEQIKIYDKLLTKYFDNLSSDEKALYYNFKGLYVNKSKKHTFNYSYFTHGLTLAKDNKIKGFLYYYMGSAYFTELNYTESYFFYQLALDIFVDSMNFKKIIWTQSDIAALHIRFNKFDEGRKIAHNTLIGIKTIGGWNAFSALIYRNIAWSYLKEKEYDNSILYSQQSLEYDSTNTTAYFYIVYSLYQTKQYDEVKKFVKRIRFTKKHFSVPSNILKILLLINDPIKGINKIESYILNPNAVIDLEDFEFIWVPLVLQYYQDINDYEKIIYYQNRLLNCQKKRNYY